MSSMLAFSVPATILSERQHTLKGQECFNNVGGPSACRELVELGVGQLATDYVRLLSARETITEDLDAEITAEVYRLAAVIRELRPRSPVGGEQSPEWNPPLISGFSSADGAEYADPVIMRPNPKFSPFRSKNSG